LMLDPFWCVFYEPAQNPKMKRNHFRFKSNTCPVPLQTPQTSQLPYSA
jgi:hypothetical protein